MSLGSISNRYSAHPSLGGLGREAGVLLCPADGERQPTDGGHASVPPRRVSKEDHYWAHRHLRTGLPVGLTTQSATDPKRRRKSLSANSGISRWVVALGRDGR